MVFTILDILQLKKLVILKIFNSVNPLHFRIIHASGYIEEKVVNKYLVFDSVDENKELLKKYNNVFNGIMSELKKYAMMSVIMKKTL